MKKPPTARSALEISGHKGSGNTESSENAAPKVAKARALRISKPKTEAAGLPRAGSSPPQRIRIEYLNPAAREVFVAGAFNQWNPQASALEAQGQGKWSIELALHPGRYEYRFVVDGQWTEDPTSPEYAANPYGGLNSVLQVETRA